MTKIVSLFKKILLGFLLPLVLLFLSTYPQSPFLFAIFQYYPAIFLFLVLVVSMVFLNGSSYFKINFHSLYLLTLLFIQLLCFLINKNITILREAALTVFCYFIFVQLSSKKAFYILTKYIQNLGIILGVSICVYACVEFSLINKENWKSISTKIGIENPFFIRQDYGEFEWFLVYNFLVVPYDVSKSFQRATLIFLEPSSLAFYCLSPFLILRVLKKSKNNKIFQSIYFLSFIFAWSIWAFLSLFVGFLGTVLTKITKSFKKFLFLIFLSISIALLSGFHFNDQNIIYKFIPTDKKAQIENSLNEQKYFYLQDDKISLFGLSAEKVSFLSSYGFETIYYRYGLLGFTFYILSLALFIQNGFKEIKKCSYEIPKLKAIFFGLLATCFFSLKANEIFLFQPFLLIWLLYWLKETNGIKQLPGHKAWNPSPSL